MPKKYTIKSGDTLKTTFKDGGGFELEGGDDFLKGLYSSDLKRVMNGERAVYFGHLNDKPLINEYPEFMGRIPIKKGPSSIVSNAVTEDAEDVFYKTAKGVFSVLDIPNKIGKKINRFGKKVEESIRPEHSEMEKFARGFVGRLIKIFGKRREMWPGLFVPGEYYENKEDADMAQSFSDAFRDAENKGLKEFEWNGERYKVERKEDGGRVFSEIDITPSEKRIREIVNMVNSSDANFVKRLKQKNRAYLNDWEHEGSIATHKMAVEIDEDGKTYMYPMVQEINGYLHDFTNPRYNAGNFDALRWAKKNNDVIEFDDILEALWFSENYKDLGIYPKFEEGGDLYKNKITNYIGGSTEEARSEYIKLDDKLRKVVKYYSDMYGINPALMMNRLAKEGVVDEGIRHYNSTNGNGTNVVDLLEDVTEDTAYSVLGLDDIFTLYKNGNVKTKRKIPFFSSSYTNEKNRVVHSANLKDVYDGFELKAATLRYFVDEARKRHKDLSQDDIDIIANSYYNRGIKGTEDDLRANIKRYKIPDYIKNVDFSNNALDNIEGVDFDIVDGKYTSPEYVKRSNNVIYDIEPLDYFYDTSKSRDAAIKLYNSVFSDEYSEENSDRYDYYNPLKDIQFRFKEGKPYYGNGNIRVYENTNGDSFSLVKKIGNSIFNYSDGGEIINNTDKLENERKEEKRTTDWISSWLDARKEILGKNSREDFVSDKSDTEIGIGEYEKQMNQLNSIDRINYDVNGLPVDESKREFLRATVRDYAGKNIEDDKLLNDELKKMFEGFVSSSDSDDRFLYYPNHPTENIRTHENTHALAYRDAVYGPSTAQSRRIADRMNTGESLMEGVEYDDYIDDANEIYSRLMEFRRENNLDPKKKYTKDDIKSFREKYKNKNDDNDSYGVIDRYNDDFLLFLLNDIAYNKNGESLDIQYAETGGMVKMNPGGNIGEKVKLLYDKLKDDAGMSDILALGVIGNLWHESGGLNEEAVGDTNTSDHAYGIQQWRGERKKKLFEFAKNRGHEKPTYEDEVDFLIEEFNTGNGGFLYGDKGKSSKAGYYNYSKNDFLQSGSLSDAVVSWNLGSGRPHKDFIANDSRLQYAEEAAKILGIKIPESESYYGNQGYNPDGVDMRTYMAQTSEQPATFNINITAEREDNNFDDWMNTYGKEMIASMYARQNEADEKSAEEERLKKAMKEEEERTKAEQAEKRQREALIAAILPNLQLNIKGMSRTES